MMMITCLILWIPGGTTYRPVGPPVTSLTDVVLLLGRWACADWAGWPDEVHAASRPAMSRPAPAAHQDLTQTRLMSIPSLSRVPETRRPARSAHSADTCPPVGKSTRNRKQPHGQHARKRMEHPHLEGVPGAGGRGGTVFVAENCQVREAGRVTVRGPQPADGRNGQNGQRRSSARSR